MRSSTPRAQLPRNKYTKFNYLCSGTAHEEGFRREDEGFVKLAMEPLMSRIETEARAMLLKRRETLRREPSRPLAGDPAASWRDWESQAVASAELTRRELDEVEAALRRIDEGNYGRCEACGGPMGLQRIRAIPEARFCLSCSGQREEVD